MSQARLRVHDVSRRHHQDTIETLQAALSEARKDRLDGVIIIMTDDHGNPVVKLGGKLSKGQAALMHLAKLSVTVILEDDDQRG